MTGTPDEHRFPVDEGVQAIGLDAFVAELRSG